MSRSSLKPMQLTRRFRGGHYAICKFLSDRGFDRGLSLRPIWNKFGVVNNRLVSAYARKSRFVGRLRDKFRAFVGRRNDPILRLTCRSLMYQDFAYGIRRKRKMARRFRLKKFFSVKKYSMLIKLGEFLRTRSYRGFRLKKDVKKIQKMKKDIKTAREKAQRQRKENARLMRKAIMETRAARRRKLGPKVKKKAVR